MGRSIRHIWVKYVLPGSLKEIPKLGLSQLEAYGHSSVQQYQFMNTHNTYDTHEEQVDYLFPSQVVIQPNKASWRWTT